MKSSWVFRRPAFPAGEERSRTHERGKRPVWLIPVALAAPVVLAIGVLLWVIGSVPIVGINVEGSRGEVAPSTPIDVTIPSFGASVVAATLKEATRGVDGSIVSERQIPVNLVPNASDSWLESTFRVESLDAATPLGYDAVYTLSVQVNRIVPAFPLFAQVTRTEDHVFSTLTTPQVRATGGVVELNYQQPVEINWNAPVQSFAVTVKPHTEVRTLVDPARPDVGVVELIQPALGTQYEMTVVEALGVNGAPLTRTARLNVETAAPSEPLVDQVQLQDGYRIAVPWDLPIREFDYAITPAVAGAIQIDRANPQMAYIHLLNPAQGQEYTVQITEAISTRGAPTSGSREFKITTPPPLNITGFTPAEQPEFGVPRSAPFTISFDREVMDRAAAEAGITIEPAVPGTFKWLSPTQVQFTPTEKWPEVVDMQIRVASGREGVKAADGGYVEGNSQFSFWAAREKMIEVNLTTFTLSLWEDGESVWSARVTTGVKGAETPPGRYEVLYKMDKTRMRGTNPSGRTYDLKDVPWVMPFWGDYAIHGNYWSTGFGQQGSNGCVGLPPNQAKYVYDWAPVGTSIRIHY